MKQRSNKAQYNKVFDITVLNITVRANITWTARIIALTITFPSTEGKAPLYKNYDKTLYIQLFIQSNNLFKYNIHFMSKRYNIRNSILIFREHSAH